MAEGEEIFSRYSPSLTYGHIHGFLESLKRRTHITQTSIYDSARGVGQPVRLFSLPQGEMGALNDTVNVSMARLGAKELAGPELGLRVAYLALLHHGFVDDKGPVHFSHMIYPPWAKLINVAYQLHFAVAAAENNLPPHRVEARGAECASDPHLTDALIRENIKESRKILQTGEPVFGSSTKQSYNGIIERLEARHPSDWGTKIGESYLHFKL